MFARGRRDRRNDGLDVAVVCGAEAKYRDLRGGDHRGRYRGVSITGAGTADRDPDDVVVPADDILHGVEISRMLPVPARQYAVIESVLRAADDMSVDDHRHALARLWSGFSSVAQQNPDAWNRSNVDEQTLLGVESNPMLATPYTKLHCSQWNVNQGAALILCSADAAILAWHSPRPLGVPARAGGVELHDAARHPRRDAPQPRDARSRRAPRLYTGVSCRPIASCSTSTWCFPSAVRLQLGANGHRRGTTVDGDRRDDLRRRPAQQLHLAVAGEDVRGLREQPDAYGLVTVVSGIVTKFAGAIWSCQPPADGSALTHDVSDVARTNRAGCRRR